MAPINSINYGLPMDNANVQPDIPFQLAPKTSRTKIFDQHPTSLGGKPENAKLNLSNTHNFAPENSTMELFKSTPELSRWGSSF